MEKRVEFTFFLLEIFLCFIPYIAIMSLQSSFNIEDGVGTTSMAVSCAASMMMALAGETFARKIGCKMLLIFGEIGLLVYVVANLYPGYATLIPASFFDGFGDVWVWIALPVIAIHYAKLQTNEKAEHEIYIRRYSSYFMGVVDFSTFVGNALGFIILRNDRMTASNAANTTTNLSATYDYSICGANDCQLPNVTRTYIKRYEPAHEYTKYIFIATIGSLNLAGILVHCFGLPGRKSLEVDEEETAPDVDLNLNTKISGKEERQPLVGSEKATIYWLFQDSTINAMKLAFSAKHLLVILLPFYSGSLEALIYSEFTRAFVSCSLGVSKVELCMMVYAVSTFASGIASGSFAARFGRNIPFLLAAAANFAGYAFCITWQITADTTWYTYVIFVVFSATSGTWETLVVALYGEYFEDNEEAAYNIWNALHSLGALWQTSISTFLCIYVKLYIQITLLAVAILCYVVSLIVYYPDQCRLVQHLRIKDSTEKEKSRLYD